MGLVALRSRLGWINLYHMQLLQATTLTTMRESEMRDEPIFHLMSLYLASQF